MNNLLTPKQASERLGITTKALEMLAYRGRIGYVKLGPKCRRFEAEEIERFIGAGRVTAFTEKEAKC